MTQQYIVGELSIRIAGMSPAGVPQLDASFRELQHQVEHAPFWALAGLVLRAIDVADAACWSSLEHGDFDLFRQEAAEAADLREFAMCAGLLP